MKKLLILMAVIVTMSQSFVKAQVAFAPSLDSIVTSSSTGTSSAIKKVEGYYNNVAIQTVISKVSGTVTGIALVQGSLDGTNYSNVTTDTLTLSNVTTNTKIWNFTGNPYVYYKVLVTVGSSTQKIYIRNYAVYRRQQQ